MISTIKLNKSFWVIITFIPILGIILSLTDPKEFASVQTVWRNRISYFGLIGPVVFILIQALQVIVTPISHYTVGVIGGFIYGPYIGGLFNWIGRIIGHLSAFFISKKWGRKIVDKYVKEDTVKNFDRYISGENGSNIQSLILFLIYFLPLFPDDEISYIVGLSKMPTKNFIIANVFGHVGGSLSLAYIGSGLNTNDPLFWILFIATLIGFPIIWILQRKQLKNKSLNK